jgi:hypothetical protein
MFRYGLKSAHADGLVTDGANGLVVPAGDVDGLRKAIERNCRDSTLRARLSAAAFESGRRLLDLLRCFSARGTVLRDVGGAAALVNEPT